MYFKTKLLLKLILLKVIPFSLLPRMITSCSSGLDRFYILSSKDQIITALILCHVQKNKIEQKSFNNSFLEGQSVIILGNKMKMG